MRKSHGGHQKSLTASIAAGAALLALVLSPVSAAYLFQASVIGQDFGGGSMQQGGQGFGGGMQQGPGFGMPGMSAKSFAQLTKRAATANKAINKSEATFAKAATALDTCASKATESSQLSCYKTNGRKAMNALNTLCGRNMGDLLDSTPCDTRDAIRQALDDSDVETLLSTVSDAASTTDGVFSSARDAIQSKLEEADPANNTNDATDLNSTVVPTAPNTQQDMMNKQMMPTTPFKMNEDQMKKQKMFNAAPDATSGDKNFEGKDFNQFGITNPQTRTGITNPQTRTGITNPQTMPNDMGNFTTNPQGNFMPQSGFTQMGGQFMNQPPMGSQFNQPSSGFVPMNNQPPVNTTAPANQPQ
ncbi:MAG: hypothetical protein NTX63_04985 [Candidatus Peregrinibacteria bacterium]|nr:hypothetical protein [Candidatus Peregrinibacteria bacterium]